MATLRVIRLAAPGVLLLVCGMAWGQSAPGDDSSGWGAVVSPFVWASSLGGHASVAGISTPVRAPFRDAVKNLDGVFMGNIELKNRQLGGFFVDGVHIDASATEQLLGLRAKVSVTSTTGALGAFFRAYSRPLDGLNAFGETRSFAIEPTAGLRWTRLSASTPGILRTIGSSTTLSKKGRSSASP
jgi:hypothetical protein